MSPRKRKILTLVLACALSLVIVGGVMGLAALTRRPPAPTGLAALAEDYGTIKLDCAYSDANHTLGVKQSTTYQNHSTQTLYEIKFHLYANAYQKDAKHPAVAPNEIASAYPNGFSAGYIKVTTPHTEIGGDDNTILTYPLSTPLRPQQSVTLDLEYTVKLANIQHRLGYTDRTVNLGNFYAIPAVYDYEWLTYPYSYNGDPFYNELYNFDVTIQAPANYVVAASGEMVAPNHYRGYLLRDFALVLSPGFQTVSRAVGDTTVTYYYLDDEIPEVSLYTAANAIAYFSNTFCDYPYSTLAVVQTDFLHGGMEYGALVYLAADITDQRQYQTVIVHEIAHQWWYGLIGNNQHETPWLDEGLAEYCTAVFFETHPQYGKTLQSCAQDHYNAIQMFENFMAEYKAPYRRAMIYPIQGYRVTSEYSINAYARAMLMFYNITEMVGYQNLNHALATFAQENCYQFATENNLLVTLERCLGKNLINYLHNYLAGDQEYML